MRTQRKPTERATIMRLCAAIDDGSATPMGLRNYFTLCKSAFHRDLESPAECLKAVVEYLDQLERDNEV